MKIFTEFPVRNLSAWVEAPTVSPIKVVTVSTIGPLATSARRRVTPLSLSRFPKKSMPSKGSPEGTMKAVSRKPMTGKKIFSFWLTTLGLGILISLSFFVVRKIMIGLWITGTRAMYEYALTAMAPIRSGASLEDRNMAVGPSAPPMMPMAPA